MSNRVVWKYELLPLEITLLPANAKVVHFGMQQRKFYVWVEVDPSVLQTVPHDFYVVATGEEIPLHAQYFGTTHEGPFVWHLYEAEIAL